MCKLKKYMSKFHIFTQILQGSALFSGKNYTILNDRRSRQIPDLLLRLVFEHGSVFSKTSNSTSLSLIIFKGYRIRKLCLGVW